jgi:hypothetical protein
MITSVQEVIKMINVILLHVGAGMTALWGLAHLFPTNSVVQGFGEISLDNKRIITMEWILKGVSLVFIGIFVSTATVIDPSSPVAAGVYVVAALALVTFAIVSLFTGFKIDFAPFKLCPFIFSTSALIILIGAFG